MQEIYQFAFALLLLYSLVYRQRSVWNQGKIAQL